MRSGKGLIKNLNSSKFILILLVIIIIVVIIVFLSKKNNQENFKCVPNLSNFPPHFKNNINVHYAYQRYICDNYDDDSICGNPNHVCDNPNNWKCALGKKMCYWEPRECKAKDPNKKFEGWMSALDVNTICGNTERIYCNPDRQCPAGWGGFNCRLSKNDCELQAPGTHLTDETQLTNETIRSAVNDYLNSETTQNVIAKYGRIEDWDVSNVTNMKELFMDKSNFNEDISRWNTSNVTDMSRMFYDALKFNQDIGNWNTSKVTNMEDMFSASAYWYKPSFNQDISRWDVSNVTNMSGMFYSAINFNQNIGGWDVSNVQDMSMMFRRANKFNQDIGRWNTSNVKDMKKMFSDNTRFNQDIGRWNTSNVTDMSNMFNGATEFNQDISQWDVSNVEDMEYMFKDAKSFNRNISNWKPKYRTTSPDWVFKGSQMYFKNMYPKEWQRYSRLR